MQTFGRGCLYIVIGLVALTLISIITGVQIYIPWFIAIPLILIAFWTASEKTETNSSPGDMSGESSGGEDE